jgi:hypothetical protein
MPRATTPPPKGMQSAYARKAPPARELDPALVACAKVAQLQADVAALASQLDRVTQNVMKVEKVVNELSGALVRFQGLVGLVVPETAELGARRKHTHVVPAFMLPPCIIDEPVK